MIIYGGIPDKITYVVRPSCEVTRGWDGLDDLWIADPVTATPAFPVDPESKKSMATAEVWAVGWHENKTPTKIEVDNTPIKAVEILTIDVRSEGGRAYKVRLEGVGDGTLYVDMREDAVLDAMLVNGVKKGGLLLGPFVWGRVQSQLRLVRVGSTLHKAMTAAKSRMAEKVISPKDYVVGGIYLTRKLEAVLYLGPVDIDRLEYRDGTDAYGRRIWKERVVSVQVRNTPYWFELENHGGWADPKRTNATKERTTAEFWLQVWEQGFTPKHCNIFGLKDTKKPVLIRHVATIDIDWKRLQDAAIEHAREAVKNGHSWYGDRATQEYSHYVHASALATVRPTGHPCPVHRWP